MSGKGVKKDGYNWLTQLEKAKIGENRYQCPYGKNCPIIEDEQLYISHALGHRVIITVDPVNRIFGMTPPTTQVTGKGFNFVFTYTCTGSPGSECGDFIGTTYGEVPKYSWRCELPFQALSTHLSREHQFPVGDVGSDQMFLCTAKTCAGERVNFWYHLGFHKHDLVCTNCEARFKNQEGLDFHNFLHHEGHCVVKENKPTRCPLGFYVSCESSFVNHVGMAEHFSSHHQDTCMVCQLRIRQPYWTYARVVSHEKSEHKFDRQSDLRKCGNVHKNKMPIYEEVDLTKNSDNSPDVVCID